MSLVLTLIPNVGDPLVIQDAADSGPIRIDHTGPGDGRIDWGDVVTEVSLAQGPDVTGAVAGTRRRPPVVVTLPIQIDAPADGQAYRDAKLALDTAVAGLAGHGGFIRRQIDIGDGLSEPLDREVISADLSDTEDEWLELHSGHGLWTLTLTCQPEWLAVEELVAEVGSVSAARVHEVTFLEAGGDGTPLRGTMPGPGRIEVQDELGQRRRFAELGWEANPDTSAGIEFLADDFELGEGAALETSVLNAYDGDAIEVTPLVPSWQVVGYLRDLPHRGAWVARTRAIFPTTDSEVQLRLSYREGAGLWQELPVQTLRTASPAAFHETAFPSFNRRGSAETMDVRVEVYSPTPDAVNTFHFNGLTLFPASAGYALARGVAIIRKAGGMVEFDDLPASGGAGSNLAGRVAPLGGTWAARGDTTPQWQFIPNGGHAQRIVDSGTDDASLDAGGFAELGTTNYTACTVVASVDCTIPFSRSSDNEVGVYARWVDASNFVRATLRSRRLQNNKLRHWVQIRKRVAGTATTLAQVEIADTPAGRSGDHIRGIVSLTVDRDGKWRCEVGKLVGETLDATRVVASGQDNVLATGGALATGRTGIYHACTDTTFVETARCFAFATHDQAQTEQLTDVVRENGSGVLDHREAHAGDFGPNIIVDPGAEVNIVNWIGFNSSPARVTSEQHTGVASFRATCGGASANEGGGAAIPPGSAGNAEFLVGREYLASCWVKADVGQALRLAVVDQTPNIYASQALVGTGDWQSVSLTHTFPATLSGPIFVAVLKGSAAGTSPTFYIDDVSFRLTSLVQPIPVYRGSRILLPPGEGRLAIKVRAGDSDAEDDRLTDHGDDPVETIRVYHRPAFASLSDALA